MRFTVVIKERRGKFLGSVPDLPGCVAVADSHGELRRRLAEAIVVHQEWLRRQGQPVPQPQAHGETIEVDDQPARGRPLARRASEGPGAAPLAGASG